MDSCWFLFYFEVKVPNPKCCCARLADDGGGMLCVTSKLVDGSLGCLLLALKPHPVSTLLCSVEVILTLLC